MPMLLHAYGDEATKSDSCGRTNSSARLSRRTSALCSSDYSGCRRWSESQTRELPQTTPRHGQAKEKHDEVQKEGMETRITLFLSFVFPRRGKKFRQVGACM